MKVLDFGLAKAWSGDSASGGSSMDLSQSPTLAHTGTQAGVILGTAAINVIFNWFEELNRLVPITR